MTHEELLKFAQALLAENTELRKMVAEEREACAKVCEDLRPSQRTFSERYWDAATHCAEAIRAKGQA